MFFALCENNLDQDDLNIRLSSLGNQLAAFLYQPGQSLVFWLRRFQNLVPAYGEHLKSIGFPSDSVATHMRVLELAFAGQWEIRLRAEAEILKNFQTLVDSADDTLFRTDMNLVVEFVSPSFHRLYGWTEKETIGSSIARFLTPTSFSRAGRVIKRELEYAANPSCEKRERALTLAFEMVCKDGSTRWLSGRIGLLKDETGKPVGVLGLSWDVTSKRMADQAQKESENRYRRLFEATHDAIVVFDLDGIIHQINTRTASLFENSKLDMIGTQVFDLLEDQNEAKFKRAMARLRQTGYLSGKIAMRTKSGKSLKLQISAHVFDQGQKLATALILDLTSQWKVEQERDDIYVQFLHAQKMEAIGRLAGGVAHDFNNVLTGIHGYAELILSSVDPEEPVYTDAMEIKKAADRASNLTRQLLAFSRKQAVSPQTSDINLLVENSRNMLARLIGEEHELEFLPGPNLPAFRIDPGQFDQILVNLSVNAKDAMPNGGLLTIATSQCSMDEGACRHFMEMRPGNYLRLSVTDQGVGMSEDTQRRIFEPFFTTKAKHYGTGLGLATVYGIVRQHGGHVAVSSVLKKGTTFSIYFPAVKKDVSVSGTEPEIFPETGRERILVVEDEPMVRSLTSKLLTKHGYQVLECQSAAVARKKSALETGVIDLLLTDVVMPGTSGIDLSQELKQKMPNLKVLFMSGYSESLILLDKSNLTGATFLRKPFTMNQLLEKVRKALDS